MPLSLLSALAAFLLLAPLAARAQNITGTLLGEVRDSSGAAFPGIHHATSGGEPRYQCLRRVV